VLVSPGASLEDIALARRLYLEASKGWITEQEVGNLATGLTKAGDESAAVQFLNDQMSQHPDLRENPWILRIRGNALIGLAKQCSVTGKNPSLPAQTKQRAWDDCRRFIQAAEQDLRHAVSLSPDFALMEQLRNHLEFIERLKVIATPPRPRSKKRQNLERTATTNPGGTGRKETAPQSGKVNQIVADPDLKTVGDLRKKYGAELAQGFTDQDHLRYMLRKTGASSIDDYLQRSKS